MDCAIKWLERVAKSVGWLSSWLILPLTLSLCYEVFARYVMGRPTLWSYEITYMLMTAIFMLGAAHTLADGAHIRIDLIYLMFSPRTQAFLDLIGYLIIFIPAVSFIAYFASDQAIYSYNTSEVSDISPWRPLMWPFRASMALGFVLLTTQGITEIMKSLLKLFGRQ